jgi:ABC-type bacteriocin/lantibiotic exporter with double-glycine peptidase domain
MELVTSCSNVAVTAGRRNRVIVAKRAGANKMGPKSLTIPLVKRRLVPEVIQSSGMDCGPAALTSYLAGHGIDVSYGRLREACQTDVDGTSIETLEELANGLGAPVEQVLVPRDAVLLDGARSLPAIAVFRLPNGNTHFAVLWSLVRGVVQIMDPASGRRWVSRRSVLEDLYEHVMTVPAPRFREWAASDDGLAIVRHRLERLGVSADARARLEEEAVSDSGWQSLAALEASARLVQSLVDSRETERGPQAERLVAALFEPARTDHDVIPASFWSVRLEEAREGSPDEVVVRGAVLLRPSRSDENREAVALPRAVAAARDEKPVRAARELWEWVKRDGVRAPVALAVAALASAGTVVLEALLFRLFLDSQAIALPLLVFLLAAFFLEAASITGELRLGRRLESRLRRAFQDKLPRLSDRYFSSRLTSDMAERLHAMHLLRKLPRLSGKILRSGLELFLTAGAIVWIAPSTAPVVVVAIAFVTVLAVPFFGQPLLHERDARVRTHVGGLSRFYLDSLLGLVALRVHGAQRAVRGEHQGLLRSWVGARLALQRVSIGLTGIQFGVGYGLVVLLVLTYLGGGGDPSRALLLAYWAMNLPVLGLELVRFAWRTPEARNVFLRATEPLRAPDETDVAPRNRERDDDFAENRAAGGMSLRLERVSVQVSGHPLLQGIDVEFAPGSHVAIVGRSGAGKTSLFGLLLGFHFPEEGRVLVDGSLLTGARLATVRSQIAWIDPAVQIWNESVTGNLLYGNDAREDDEAVERTMDEAELRHVVASLPRGRDTKLGEGGALVSGGEGQRVRLGRALLRTGVRLALLDEPFRGLDRRHRSELVRRARARFRGATLLAITHDVRETEEFDRVLVLEGGRLVEDGRPQELLAREDSRYRRLLAAEIELQNLWSDGFRPWSIENGRLEERSS